MDEGQQYNGNDSTGTVPRLMPFQEAPFNGDKHLEAEVLRLKKEFHIDVILECGTCLGSTTIWMAQNFQRTHTIEINQHYHEIAHKRMMEQSGTFKDHILCNWFGDSVKILPKIFKHTIEEFAIREKCMIFIDSHWQNNVPMLEELAIIAATNIRPVIIIHDFLVPGHPELGFDSYHDQPFTFEWIQSSIEKIYGTAYKYHYNTIASGAKRGVIFIYPA